MAEAEPAGQTIETMLLEERRYPPPPEFAAQANAQPDSTSATSRSSGSAEGRERVTWFEPFPSSRVGAAVREVVPRREAQRLLQLRRPACRGRARRQGRVPLGGRARGRPARGHLRRPPGARSCGFANALKALGVRKGTPVGIYMGMVPELRDRDARLRAARRAAHGRLRRLLRRLALRPAQRHGLRGADHAGRGVAARHDGAAEADRRRGAGRRAAARELRRPAPDRQRGPDGPRAGTPAGTIVEGKPDDPEHVPASRWTPRTCSICSTRRARPRSRRASSTRRPATSSASPSTHHYIFDLKRDDDVYWCAADIGWITGHSYIVYGPLANGATCVIYEGTPDFPDKDRWWDIVERYGVTILYTAPTAIRAHMKWGPEHAQKHDLSSLGCWARSASRSTPRPGCGTASTSAEAAPRSSTPGGRPRPG